MQLTSLKENQAFFTIVTKSHLAFARAMASQLKKIHPDLPLVVFLADNPDGCFDPAAEPFPVIPLGDFLPAHLLETMPAYYTVSEFCNALKGFAHLHLWSKTGLERWLYLDADIFICGSFDRVFSALNGHAILLTPHILLPGRLARTETIERNILKYGLYNGGCVGICKTPSAREFLEWWMERLTKLCLANVPGLYHDQAWLNFVPLLFGEVNILRDPEVNIAYWNLHERHLQLVAEESATVDGNRVPFLHLSGWDWHKPEIVSRWFSPASGNESQPVWQHLTQRFLQILFESGINETSRWPYSFAKAEDGTVLTPEMRRAYWNRLKHQASSQAVPSLFASPRVYSPPGALTSAARTLLGTAKQHFFK